MVGLSIIIIALNEEKYLSHLFNSLLKQTNNHFEVILVDSNSKDNTLNIAKAYSKKFNKFKIVKLKSAKGPGYARNRGAKKATYNHLLFLDSDTILKKDFIERVYKIINNKINVATFLLKVDDKLRYKFLFCLNNFFIYFSKYTTKKLCTGAAGILSTKRIHNKINGFDKKIIYGEDSSYFNKATKFDKFDIFRIYNYTSARRFKQNYFKLLYQIIKVNLERIILKKEIYNNKKINYPFGEN